MASSCRSWPGEFLQVYSGRSTICPESERRREQRTDKWNARGNSFIFWGWGSDLELWEILHNHPDKSIIDPPHDASESLIILLFVYANPGGSKACPKMVCKNVFENAPIISKQLDLSLIWYHWTCILFTLSELRTLELASIDHWNNHQSKIYLDQQGWMFVLCLFSSHKMLEWGVYNVSAALNRSSPLGKSTRFQEFWISSQAGVSYGIRMQCLMNKYEKNGCHSYLDISVRNHLIWRGILAISNGNEKHMWMLLPPWYMYNMWYGVICPITKLIQNNRCIVIMCTDETSLWLFMGIKRPLHEQKWQMN